jgi:hypothetical protein
MSLSMNERIARNTIAIEALKKSADVLRDLRKGKTLTVRKRFDREIARVNEQITELEIVNGHLRASTVVIDPIDNATVARLDALATKIDQAIKNSFVINATFDTVLDVISFAEEVGAIIQDHQHA